MGYADSSRLAKNSLSLGISAFIHDIIGLVSPYWLIFNTVDFESNHFLFKSCFDGECVSIQATTEVMAAQAMNIIGCLAGTAAVVLIALYIFVINKPIVRLGGIVISFVGAGFILTGVIILGDTNRGFFDIGWAMIMAIIGALLYIFTGILLIVDIVKPEK